MGNLLGMLSCKGGKGEGTIPFSIKRKGEMWRGGGLSKSFSLCIYILYNACLNVCVREEEREGEREKWGGKMDTEFRGGI